VSLIILGAKDIYQRNNLKPNDGSGIESKSKSESIYISAEDLAWNQLWIDFLEDISIQKRLGWPSFVLIKKVDKKIDVDMNGEISIKSHPNDNKLVALSTSPFISSQNLLTLLFRIIYTETCKENYLKMSSLYQSLMKKDKDLTRAYDKPGIIYLSDLFDNLEKHLKLYISTYSDWEDFEHQLGLSVLKLIKNSSV